MTGGVATVQDLRAQSLPGRRRLAGADIAGGLQFFADGPARAQAQWASPRGRLLDLDVEVRGDGAWMGLHLSLGKLPLAGCGALVIFARAAAPEAFEIRPCLRSGLVDGGFEDCFFALHMAAHPAASDHLDHLVPGRDFRLPDTALWRELVLFLPVQSLSLSLINLRVLAG